jgi:hypothetical protein
MQNKRINSQSRWAKTVVKSNSKAAVQGIITWWVEQGHKVHGVSTANAKVSALLSELNATGRLINKKDAHIKRLTDALNECNLDRMHELGKLNRALDEIQGIISGQFWDSDTVGMIADVIMSTGREILDIDEI